MDGMTPEEARQESLAILGKTLGLDEFQMIAVQDISADLEGFTWPPEPGSEHEKKLIELGAIVGSKFMSTTEGES